LKVPARPKNSTMGPRRNNPVVIPQIK